MRPITIREDPTIRQIRSIPRRDFQVAAATTLDKQAAALTASREFMADLSTRLDTLTQRQIAFEQRPWRARLRWLVTGR